MAQIGGGMRNSAIDSSDRTQLLQDDVETRGRSCCTHKRLLCFFIALLLIIAGHVIAIYYIHLRCTPENNCVPLKVRYTHLNNNKRIIIWTLFIRVSS